MGLSATLNIAQSALATNAALSSIVSRNIAGVNDPNYSRKIGEVSTGDGGAGLFTGVGRATDQALFANLLSANADSTSSKVLADGLDQLEQTVNLTGASNAASTSSASDTSPATAIGKLTDALQTFAAQPADPASAAAVLASAKSVANTLNTASATVDGVRAQADKDIATSVSTINGLLKQFGEVNATIVDDKASNADATDALDQRGKILQALSREIGIGTVDGPNGGLSIYTDGGATLFQGAARTVSFTPTSAFAAGTSGGAVSVDGVPVTGPGAVMPIRSGRIAGLTQLRDVAAVDYQQQLDQIAGGLITTFAETDQAGGGNPAIPGLFTHPGAPAMPAAGQAGLAASLAVSASADPAQGGNVDLIRDGGVGAGGNAAYTWNTSAAAGFSDRVRGLIANLDATQTFDPTSGGAAKGTVAGYAASSVSWLEASRQGATGAASSRGAVATQTATSLSSATGVNLDDQMSQMLDLEHSYQASAELISTVKTMLDSLLSAIH